MIAQSVLTFAAAAATLLALADGQTFQRLGGCPTLGEFLFAVSFRKVASVKANTFIARLRFPSGPSRLSRRAIL